jgi:hypothetical protein
VIAYPRIQLLAGFLVALVGYFCVNGGLFTWLPALQIGVFVGVMAGALIAEPYSAGLIAVAAASAGIMLEPANRIDFAGPLIGNIVLPIATIVVAAGVSAAALSRWRVRNEALATRWLLSGAMILIVINLVGTTGYLATRGPFLPGQTVVQALDAPATVGARGDLNFYRRVVDLMRSGMPYYAAFRQAYNENPVWAGDPSVVANVRPPTLFWFWTALPSGAVGVLVPMMLLGCAAVIAAPQITRVVVPDSVALVSSAGLASYFLFFSVSNGVYFSEQWVGALAVLCAAFMTAAFAQTGRAHARIWIVAAVGVAVLATFVRELGAYLLVAGIASAWFVETGRLRRFSVAAWAIGIGAVVIAAWAHVGAASRILTPVLTAGSGYARWFSGGGPSQVLSGIRWGSFYFGQSALGAYALAALGVLGAWMLQSRSLRAFAVIAVTTPLVAFLFVGSDFTGAIGESGAGPLQHMNYWGPIVVPLALALAPAAFALFPHLRRAGRCD